MATNGFDAQESGERAEISFRTALKIWFSGTGVSRAEISKDDPDVHGIDLRCDIRSSQYSSSVLSCIFQIKTTSVLPVRSSLYGEPAYRVSLKPRAFQASLAAGPRVFLVVASPTSLPRPMLHKPAAEWFRWYAVELHEYISRYQKAGGKGLPEYVDVPVRNRLNAAIASVVWGSWWVYESFNSLWSPKIYGVKSIERFRDRYITSSIKEFEVAGAMINPADIEAVRAAMAFADPYAVAALHKHIGGAYAVRSIQHQLLTRGARDYYSFACEAAREEVNYWLFYRLYRQHLRFSSRLLNELRAGQYVRFIPVLPANEMPSHLLLAHIHAARVHRALKIDGVLELIDDPRGVTDRVSIDDTSYESHFVDAGSTWDVHIEQGGRSSEDRDFFRDVLREFQMPKDLTWRETCLLRDSGLPEDQLSLSGQIPLDLLAPEGPILEHPRELWDSAGRWLAPVLAA